MNASQTDLFPNLFAPFLQSSGFWSFPTLFFFLNSLFPSLSEFKLLFSPKFLLLSCQPLIWSIFFYQRIRLSLFLFLLTSRISILINNFISVKFFYYLLNMASNLIMISPAFINLKRIRLFILYRSKTNSKRIISNKLWKQLIV